MLTSLVDVILPITLGKAEGREFKNLLLPDICFLSLSFLKR